MSEAGTVGEVHSSNGINKGGAEWRKGLDWNRDKKTHPVMREQLDLSWDDVRAEAEEWNLGQSFTQSRHLGMKEWGEEEDGWMSKEMETSVHWCSLWGPIGGGGVKVKKMLGRAKAKKQMKWWRWTLHHFIWWTPPDVLLHSKTNMINLLPAAKCYFFFCYVNKTIVFSSKEKEDKQQCAHVL